MLKEKTPILFLVFNRPDCTKKVLEAIRQYQPTKLFIAADGPRKDRPGERELCAEVREMVLKSIDWPCEVHTAFQENNLGCKLGVSSAIDWFFSMVEEGVILEDDCVPDQSFFTYCSTLLEKYRHDSRVMHIGGATHYNLGNDAASYYYFTNFPRVWGWATWRRAWKLYDRAMPNYNPFDLSYSKNRFHSFVSRLYWDEQLHKTSLGLIDTWDYQWMFTICNNNGYSIGPAKNLIRNVGFGSTATHTKNEKDFSAGLAFAALSDVDFAKPDSPFIVNIDADTYFERKTSKHSLIDSCKIILRFVHLKVTSILTIYLQ